VIGWTSSEDYPTTRGAFDRSFSDASGRTPGANAFVSKLDPAPIQR
jgi:hypothetical protein